MGDRLNTINVEDLPERMAGPVTYRILSTEPIMMLHLIIPPNVHLPEHAHDNFQMGYILSGSALLTIGGEESQVRQGMAYVIPANVPHGLQTHGDSLEMLDVYYPPRGDRS